MDTYTITIAPNDDSGNTTTLVVDTSGDQVRITDVHLHATDGLSGGQMPRVDFRLLLQAVAPAAGSAVPIDAAKDGTAAPADTPAPADAPAPVPVPEAVDETTAAAEAQPATATASRPVGRTRSRRAPAAPTAAAKATPTATKRGAATATATKTTTPKKAATAKKTTTPTKTATARKAATAKKTAAKRATKKAAAPTETGGRAYRRMPADFASVYRQTSMPAAIADHYGVPRHTAQGWIRRQKAINASTGG
jgi:hypothetical protein